jgi:hypothetical protein
MKMKILNKFRRWLRKGKALPNEHGPRVHMNLDKFVAPRHRHTKIDVIVRNNSSNEEYCGEGCCKHNKTSN